MENRKLLKAMHKARACIIIILVLLCRPYAAWSGDVKQPTAVIIDNATGQPIEGAIALAQWTRYSPLAGAWFEGGKEWLTKIQETYSDKDGKIYIDDYWAIGIYFFDHPPTLTVYKPGYVVWNSKIICPDYEKRKDFDKEHRTVRLLNFDTDAPMWVKKDPHYRYPHILQDVFFTIHCLMPNDEFKWQIDSVYLKHEKNHIDKEGDEYYKATNKKATR